MVNYNNSMIYKICCNDPTITEIYIGSTTNLIRRRAQHKKCCNKDNDRGHNYYVYQFIRDNGGWDNWSVILVEKCENITSKPELTKRERHYIETLKSSLNRRIPGRTKKEWTTVNKEKIIEYQKEYYSDNKEKIKQSPKCYTIILPIQTKIEIWQSRRHSQGL